MNGHPSQWDQVVTCRLCGHTSRAQYKRTGYSPGTWICLSRKACTSRQRHKAALASRMTRQEQFANAIADFNAQHGVSGLQIGAQTITNEQLRDWRSDDPTDRFVEANNGRSFKRPNGRVVYTVQGAVDNPTPFFGPRRLVVVRRSSDQQQATMSVSEFRQMEVL